MGKFKYTDGELEINKVLKMNQDLSQRLLNDDQMDKTRCKADESIDKSVALLRLLGYSNEVDDILNKKVNVSEEENAEVVNKPEIENWEDLVSQADECCPDVVELEDIMTQDEIQASFEELDDISKTFSQKTGIINKTDLSFLFVATALQVAKSLIFPYVAGEFNYGEDFNPDDRLNHNDKTIEKAHQEAIDKFREKHKNHPNGYWINILYQTVPYDITRGSKELGINMGGRYHRMYTLGHDPILGWIFGTANILTDCITFNTFKNNRISREDPITKTKKMTITSEIVPLSLMFQECYECVKSDSLNLPAALFTQSQHFKSDKYTKMGLPVPIISSINEKFASKLYKKHYDALCFSRDVKIVGVSFVVSKLIDLIIILLHGFFRKEEEDKDLYEVRTRKILLISSTIASTSTCINAAITKNPKNLDIGGLLNTLTHLFSDIRFITKVKNEFINSEISNRLENEVNEIDRQYNLM